MRPKVGDTVLFSPPHYRGRLEFSDRLVDKVGRKYFYVGHYKFTIDDKPKAYSVEGSNYCAVAYINKSAKDEEEAHSRAVVTVAAMFDRRWEAELLLANVPTENIEKAIALLRGNAAGDGDLS